MSKETRENTRGGTRQRSAARALALQALCLYDSLGDSFAPQMSAFLRDPENLADLAFEGQLSDETSQFAAELANGAWASRVEIDRVLQEASPDWALKRMPPVDRNILRLGLHEWRQYPETAFSVIINEGIELARKFGGADSPKFVNGVLDGIRRKLEQESARAAPGEEHA